MASSDCRGLRLGGGRLGGTELEDGPDAGTGAGAVVEAGGIGAADAALVLPEPVSPASTVDGRSVVCAMAAASVLAAESFLCSEARAV